MAPTDRRYQTTHEWAKRDGSLVTVGITDVAVERLSDLVYVELPSPGRSLAQGEVFGEIESVKAVSELLSPVTGRVTAVHSDLADHLDDLAADPFGEGWMIKVEVDGDGGLEALLDASAYEVHAAAEDH